MSDSKKRMHSLFDLTADQADAWFGWSNMALIIGALLALLGTIGTIWTSKVKERYSDARIAAAEVETARAKEGAELARKETAILNERAEGLQKESAQLRVEAERLKLRLAEETGFRLPRSLRLRDGQALVGRLKQGPLGKVRVKYQPSDPEAKRFAEDISFILKEAGFIVEPEMGAANFTDEGQFIFVRSMTDAPPHASNIRDAFRAFGVHFLQTGREGLGADEVVLGISSKPSTTFVGP